MVVSFRPSVKQVRMPDQDIPLAAGEMHRAQIMFLDQPLYLGLINIGVLGCPLVFLGDTAVNKVVRE